MAKFKRSTWVYGIIGIIVLCTVVWFVWPQAPTPETPQTKLTSTFKTISSVDREDVSPFVECNIWVPKSSAVFDDPKDPYRISTHFEKAETGKDADDIAIDLREYDYAWLEITGNSLFSVNFHKLSVGANYDYIFPVYDLTSDLNFNMLIRDSLATVTVADYQTNGNFTILMDVNHIVKTDCHYGDDWTISTTDFNDMTLSEKKEVWDEALWQSQAPLYDPRDDEEKEYDNALERLTEAFCLRLQFNTTVSTVDGNVAQINMTINDASEPIEIIISGEYIYLLFYEEIKFDTGAYTFDFSLKFAANITLSDIDSGRITVPRGDDNLKDFVKISDIGA